MNFKKATTYYNTKRTDLVDMLPSIQGRFLEVGCGSGATLEYLKSKGASYVAGIDFSSDAIAEAKKRGLDFALVADIERDELPFGRNEFDCIIFADVLEHLYDPWDTLKKMAFYLKDEGRVLLSIPNIKHYTILRRLIFFDEWTYTDLGILDNSHIRFFTLKEIKRLLEGTGLTELETRFVVNAGKNFSFLNKFLLNKLWTFSVVQYYVMAKK